MNTANAAKAVFARPDSESAVQEVADSAEKKASGEAAVHEI
jgi:hypothetical protein